MIRVLLDENLPRKLKWALEADAVTVPERGWGGIKNGQLLRMVALEFDVLLTMDRGMEHQQNVREVDLCLIVLSAVSNDIDDLLPLAPSINAALTEATPGRTIRVAEEHALAQQHGCRPVVKTAFRKSFERDLNIWAHTDPNGLTRTTAFAV